MKLRFLLFLPFLLLAAAAAVRAEAPTPDYLPTCTYAQDIAPTALAGGSFVNYRSPVVWNGKDFGVAWVESTDGHLYFRRLYADGTPVGAAAVLSTRASLITSPPDLVWTGSGYAVVWAALDTTNYAIYMVRLDASGALVAASETKIGQPAVAKDSFQPRLAWGGSTYCCVFTFKFNAGTDHDIYASLVNASGGIVYRDYPMITAGQIQENPAVAWFPAASTFVLAWDDYRSGTQYQIYANTLSTGASVGIERALVTPPGTYWARQPSLAVATNSNFLGLAWGDTRNTYVEPYFQRFDQNLTNVGTAVRAVPATSYNEYSPNLVWTGAEFGLLYEDFRGGNRDIWYQSISATGTPNGNPRQILYTSYSGDPAAAFARRGWLVTGHGNGTYNFAQPVGCSYVYTPPCPENVLAYNVSGSQATLAWLPAQDDYVDTAYYQVYRNNSLVGITDNTVYTDTGLTPGATYNYAVRTVNAAQSVSSGCPATASVYVKTSASLTLLVNKSASGTDASLSWTDAGLGSYNVFRGTTPQTMGLIGTTATLAADDKGALTDGVLYYYTVDDPGQ